MKTRNTRYIIQGTQRGTIFDLGSENGYSSLKTAKAAAADLMRHNIAHPDFTYGGEDRFEWSIKQEKRTDASSEWEYFNTPWIRKANAR